MPKVVNSDHIMIFSFKYSLIKFGLLFFVSWKHKSDWTWLSIFNEVWWEKRGNHLRNVEKLREVVEKLSDNDLNDFLNKDHKICSSHIYVMLIRIFLIHRLLYYIKYFILIDLYFTTFLHHNQNLFCCYFFKKFLFFFRFTIESS